MLKLTMTFSKAIAHNAETPTVRWAIALFAVSCLHVILNRVQGVLLQLQEQQIESARG
jgi:hypothetical protein